MAIASNKRLSAPERRSSLIKAAKALFADKGFHGVSIDEIVNAVGVSPAILYRHFKSKDELYDAVLQDFSCQRESYVDTIVSSDADFETILRGITAVFIDSIVRQPDLLKIELYSILEGHDAHRKFFLNRWKTFTDFIEYSLNELQSRGKLSRIDSKASALMYQGMLREVLLLKCLQHSEHLKDYSLQELLDKMISQFITSLELNN
ncbi:MAG: TetR/AcrR family transcriptional regulator [Gammaproteobacteria bacterium]|nr:TetR/AcrR family transcriptional regulator [Gammaproteobacteria bacterium]